MLCSEISYLNGKEHGMEKGWYIGDKGQRPLMYEHHYHHGEKCGIWKNWSADGVLKFEKFNMVKLYNLGL